MKKITLLMVALLLSVVGVNATELWTGSCTIGNYEGSEVGVDKASFESAAAGNIIKVTFSAYAETESDNVTPVTYWQYSLGQKDNGWTGLTGFSGGDLTKGQKSASYTLTETNVTELKNYGLSVNGRYITVTKVELLTISTTESLWTGSQETGNWTNNVVLTYADKGNLANAQMNDYIRMTYTVTASGAQAAIQNAGWQSLIGKDDNSYVAEGDNTGKTLTLTIDDASTLENIQQKGILVRGKNITITAVDLVEPDNRYDAVPLTIGADGIATFGSSKHLDFTGTGVTPYYATTVETGKVTLTSTDKTRAWSGCIVKGEAGYYEIPVTDEVAWQDYMAYLVSTGEGGAWVYRSAYSDYSGDNETKIKTYYRYIFSKDGEGIGFFKLATDYSRVTTEKEGDNESGTTVYYHVLAAHKAYLETTGDITPSGDPDARLVLKFEDDPTAIGEVKSAAQPVKADNVYYNLNGQRVEKPTKGIYILNGRKVLF